MGSGKLFEIMAASLPLGVYGPAEVYDILGIHDEQTDLDWYSTVAPCRDEMVSRIPPPVNMMEVHVPIATSEGTIASLTRMLQDIAAKIRAGAQLTPAQTVWLDYDAIQLMPLHPTVHFESAPPVFVVHADASSMLDSVVMWGCREPQHWGGSTTLSSVGVPPSTRWCWRLGSRLN